LISEAFHIVSSIGDPADPKIWSGTPKALVDAFRKRVPSLKVHDVTFGTKFRVLYQIANVLSGLGGKQAYRVGFWKLHQGHFAQKYLNSLGPGVYLHLGSGHLPLKEIRPGEAHYYFTDYTVELMLNDSPFSEQVPARYKKSVLQQEAQLLKQMTGVFTTADYVRERIISTRLLPASKVLAVGSGMGRVQAFKGNSKDYRNGHLLFVAKQNFRGKGGYLLLDAIDIAIKARPKLRFVIIGNLVDPQASDAISRMQNHPSIDFFNWDTPHFRELVESSALYVGPAYNEPYGIIYLESLLCETPILGLNRNAFPQFADHGKCGFIVDEPDAESVAAAIIDAMSDTVRLRSMGIAGRQYVLDNYTWDKSVAAMIDFIDNSLIATQ
jgi:glycosyltransferase involved in cell wall biosynthesis